MTQVDHVRSRSAAIRQALGYPVIDGDGHVVELLRVFIDYAHDHGHGEQIEAMRPRLVRGPEQQEARLALSPTELRRAGSLPDSWHVSANPDYYATVAVPGLYYERLGEAGIDFAVLYPTLGINMLQLLDDEHRVTVCRLYNEFMTEQYRPFNDRFTVAALIPMHTPEEAVEALVHAKELGAKVGLIPSHVRRPVPGDPWPPNDPGVDLRIPEWDVSGWVDTFGIDSAHHYDPVWAKAIELRMPLAAHTAGIGFSDRASTSNFVYNQIGHFAAAGEALAKSLFLGGVTHRFPALRIALLEGGVAAGVSLLNGLVHTWEKRSGNAMTRLDPAVLDRDRLRQLLADDPLLSRYTPEELLWAGGPKRARDDFAATQVTSVDDLCEQFGNCFAWGCEGDDPLVGLAFDPRVVPLGARVPAILGSDLGHWDVPDFDAPLEETFELLERGILDEQQFREFVCDNPVRFYSSLNPDFFAGTAVAAEAATINARPSS